MKSFLYGILNLNSWSWFALLGYIELVLCILAFWLMDIFYGKALIILLLLMLLVAIFTVVSILILLLEVLNIKILKIKKRNIFYTITGLLLYFTIITYDLMIWFSGGLGDA